MTDWKFDVDDLGESDDDRTESNENDTDMSNPLDPSMLALLPLSIAGVYAFIEKAAVIAALEALFGGATGFATAIGTALWVVGAVSVGFLAIVAITGVVAFILALIKRSGLHLVISVLIGSYFAIAGGTAMYVFESVPLLVGFFIASNLLVWGVAMLVMLVTIIGALAIA